MLCCLYVFLVIRNKFNNSYDLLLAIYNMHLILREPSTSYQV